MLLSAYLTLNIPEELWRCNRATSPL